MKEILTTIFLSIVYSILYTITFVASMYLFSKISFYHYSLIDQYIILIYAAGIILLLGRDVLYNKSIGVFLLPTCVFALYLSIAFSPLELPQYTHIGSCDDGDLYLHYLGPYSRRRDLVYFPGERSVSVKFDRDTYEIEPYPWVELSKFDESCVLKDPYNITRDSL